MNNIKTAERLFFDGLGFLDTHDFISAELRFREALKLVPTSVPVLTNLAAALFARDKITEALEFAKRAIASDVNNIEAHLIIANCFAKKRHYAEALASCDKIIALEPTFSEMHINRAVALIELNRPEESLASCDRAIAMVPNFADAYYNRGNALIRLRRHQEALASYDKAIAIKPDFAKAWMGRGNIFVELKRHVEAAAAYGKALSINPDIEEAEGACLHMKMHSCDWNNFKDDCSRVMAGVRKGLPVASPFVILGIPSTPADQLECAKSYAARVFPAVDNPLWRNEIYSHDRIRIAYLSADFHDHATAHLMAGLFEHHDRTQFSTVAISFRANDGSAMRARLVKGFDRFFDGCDKSDEEIANLIRGMETDIAIDLKGFTQDSRPNIFAMRAAPVQVNYLGYPGTMGAEFLDYIISDKIIIPADQHQYYSEKIAYMPHSYQANDAARHISEIKINRRDAGLPEQGFVFCSFNNSFKITPDVFDIWMRLLQQVDGSVLWLLAGSSSSQKNLKREAQKRGISQNRLIFAPRTKIEDHLARHRLADVFLDTLPYNAHTTASDALWAGLPVLTCLGSTFAGRVAASLLNAVGLNELVTTKLDDYEALALKLARAPGLLASLKAKLADNRLHCPLFDTQRFTRYIEAAYITMWERYRCGQPPADFAVDAIKPA